MHLNYTYETCKNGIIWDSQALTGSDKKKSKSCVELESLHSIDPHHILPPSIHKKYIVRNDLQQPTN